MPRCNAIKRNGERCRVSVEPGVELCWAHDPRNASQRKRITSKAGKSKPSRELIGIKERLSTLAEDVLDGGTDRADAAVASQVYNVLLRAIGMTLKVRELEESEAKLEEMEKALERQGEGDAYGSAG